MFQIYEALGGLGKESMQNEIINDYHLLEEIVGELDYENMEMVRYQNPNVYLMMLFKIVAMLGYLAKYPTTDANGNVTGQINLYQKALDHLIQEYTNDDDEKPGWIRWIEMIFHVGVKVGTVVDIVNEQVPE